MGSWYTFGFRTTLQIFGVILLIIVLLSYITFQARNVIQGPSITLLNVPESPTADRIISLTGTAHNIVKLTLNGKEIHTNKTGEFTQELVLENGYTITTLWAQDRFGRTTTVSREFVHIASSSESENTLQSGV